MQIESRGLENVIVAATAANYEDHIRKISDLMAQGGAYIPRARGMGIFTLNASCPQGL